MKRIIVYVPLAVIFGLLVYLVIDSPNIASKISYSVAKGRADAIRDSLPELSQHDYMSKLFGQVATSIKPSVVEIRVIKRVAVDTSDIEEFIRRFREDNNIADDDGGGGRRGADSPDSPNFLLQRGLGSGLVVDAENGYILTNHHVVAGADQIEIVLWTGRTVEVEWIRHDPPTDLALLKVNNLHAPAAPVGDSDTIHVGDWVLAVGAPEGLAQSVTAGIISARNRSTCDVNSCRSFIQTDAAINRGNSGGPLVNLRGEVIGIATAIVSSSGGSDGIGLAIPSNVARRVMTELIERGQVVRGQIGLAAQDVDTRLVRALNLPGHDGALVTQVARGGPAERAGLAAGDFITSIDDRVVNSVATLREIVGATAPGSQISIEFHRRGERRTTSATVEERRAAGGQSTTQPTTRASTDADFGLRVTTATDRLARRFGHSSRPEGALITSIVGGSEADRHRLRPGMVVVQVNDRKVATAEEFRRALAGRGADGVTLLVVDPSGQSRFVFLDG